MDIEQRLAKVVRTASDTQIINTTRIEEIERYLKVIQPINTFATIAETLHNSLAEKMLVNFIDYE